MDGLTHFLLIRHAVHALGGDVIAGTSDAACLSERGWVDARALGERLAGLPITHVYSSPVLRTRQTAGVIAERLGLEMRESPALAEVGFGEWGGKRLDELRPLEQWKRWNEVRSLSLPPGGEMMAAVQVRAVGEMMRLAAAHRGGVVALVSHGDVIKYTLGYLLGMPIDLCKRLAISQASVSVVAISDGGPWVLGVNNTGRVELGPQ